MSRNSLLETGAFLINLVRYLVRAQLRGISLLFCFYLGNLGSFFTFCVITSSAVLKGSLKKQCCYCFLHHLLFLECVFSYPRPWDKPAHHIRFHWNNSLSLLLNLLFCCGHLSVISKALMVS